MLPMPYAPCFCSPLYSPALYEPSPTSLGPTSTVLVGLVWANACDAAPLTASATMMMWVFMIASKRSALELRPGRMIRSVHEDVTIETRARARLDARRRGPGLLQAVDRGDVAGREVRAAVDLCAVVAAVTLLAQPRRARLEERALLDPCGVWQFV